jgi:hypothetical protein
MRRQGDHFPYLPISLIFLFSRRIRELLHKEHRFGLELLELLLREFLIEIFFRLYGMGEATTPKSLSLGTDANHINLLSLINDTATR